jgi:hypothetical protein
MNHARPHSDTLQAGGHPGDAPTTAYMAVCRGERGGANENGAKKVAWYNPGAAAPRRANLIALPLPPRQGERARGLCIPCAVAHFHFTERAPLLDCAVDGEGTPRAWINGRGYRLLHHPARETLCVECGRRVYAAYIPEDQQADG